MRRLRWVESGLLHFRVLLARKAVPSRLPSDYGLPPGTCHLHLPCPEHREECHCRSPTLVPPVRTMRQHVVVLMLLVATLLNARGYQTAPKADGPHGARVAPLNGHRVVIQGPVAVESL